jgi:ATP synthase protein I|nr:ATP synthase subunit I [uncultured Thiocystis sp.]
MQQPGAFQAKRILKIQFAFGLAMTILALPFGNSVAISVLVGSGTCLLANSLLAVWVFREYRAAETARLAMRFYRGEAAKIALILGLFATAFAVIDNLNLPVMLGAYVAVQVIPTLIAAQFGSRNMT